MRPTTTPGKKKSTNLLGKFIIEKLDYDKSNQTVYIYQLTAIKECNTNQLLDAIQDKGYENFDFTSDSTGCRYWAMKVLELLKSKGFIGEYPVVLSGIKKLWDEEGSPGREHPVEKGSFH